MGGWRRRTRSAWGSCSISRSSWTRSSERVCGSGDREEGERETRCAKRHPALGTHFLHSTDDTCVLGNILERRCLNIGGCCPHGAFDPQAVPQGAIFEALAARKVRYLRQFS